MTPEQMGMNISDWTPAQRQSWAQVHAEKGPQEGMTYYTAVNAAMDEQAGRTASQKVRQIGNRLRSMSQPVSLEQVAPYLDLTPREQNALKGIDPQIFLGSNIVPPTFAAKAGEAAMVKGAEVGAMEQTQTGQADIAAKQAATRKAGFMTVPGQGGAVIQLPGAGGPAGAPVAGPQQGLTPQSGLQTAPGVGVLAQSPGPGMSPEAANQLIRAEEKLSALEHISTLMSDKDVDQYLGPALSRKFGWGVFKEYLQKKAPSFMSKVPDILSDLDQLGAIVGNITIITRTGAAVRETEEPRLKSEIPDRNRDKPEAFRRKLANTLHNARMLVRRYRELVGPDGRVKANVDVEAVRDKYALKFSESAKSPADMSDEELKAALRRDLP